MKYLIGLFLSLAVAFSYAKEKPPVIMEAQVNPASFIQLHAVQGDCPEGSRALTLFYMRQILAGCWRINPADSTLIDVVDEQGDSGTLPVVIFKKPGAGV